MYFFTKEGGEINVQLFLYFREFFFYTNVKTRAKFIKGKPVPTQINSVNIKYLIQASADLNSERIIFNIGFKIFVQKGLSLTGCYLTHKYNFNGISSYFDRL